jgi:hypothetical protein
MPQANIIQTNFTSGEISPLMYGRSDVTKYFNGAKKLQNFIVRPQGGIVRRTGTRYIAATKDSTKRSMLKEFIFSQSQAYLLEFGDLYMRVYSGVSYTGVEIVTPWAATDLDQLYFTQSADILYVAHPNFQTRKISRTSLAPTFAIGTMDLTDGPYLDEDTSGAKLKFAITTDSLYLITANGTQPFVAGDINKITDFKLGDQWYIGKILNLITNGVEIDFYDHVYHYTPAASLTFAGGVITSDKSGVFTPSAVGNYIRVTNGTWYVISAYTSDIKVAAALPPETYKSSGYPAAALVQQNTAGRTITGNITSTQAIFSANDAGRSIRLQYGSNVLFGTIAGFTSTTSVVASLSGDAPRDSENAANYYNGGVADSFRLGAFFTGNWPAIVGFHEQRFVFANTPIQPQTLFMSRSSDYQNFAPTELDGTVVADNGMTYTIASNRANPIAWIETGPVMTVGTIGGEWQVKATNLNEPITPTNIDMKEQTRFGSDTICRPHRIGSAVIYLQRGGNKVREMAYDFSIDSFISKDMTIMSEHILRSRGGGYKSAWQGEYVGTMWFVSNNFVLSSMTYEKDQDVVAWAQHKIGGPATGAFVESVAVVPNTTTDSVFLIVRRTINGGIKRYIEKIDSDFQPEIGQVAADGFYCDSGLQQYTPGTFSTSITGVNHLEGETVQVSADGIYYGTAKVNAGVVIVPNNGKGQKIVVGYGLSSVMTSVDPEGGSALGTSQGKTKRIDWIDVRVKDSMPFKLGKSEDPTELRKVTSEFFRELKTGIVRVSADTGFNSIGEYTIVQDEPYPLTITAIMPHLKTNE